MLLPHPVPLLPPDFQLHHMLPGREDAQEDAAELRIEQKRRFLWQRLLYALLLPLLLSVPRGEGDRVPRRGSRVCFEQIHWRISSWR